MFPFNSLLESRPDQARIVLGTDLMVTSPKGQRYVPEMDLAFDAAPRVEQTDNGNPGSISGFGRGSRWWRVAFHQVIWLSPVGWLSNYSDSACQQQAL